MVGALMAQIERRTQQSQSKSFAKQRFLHQSP
jgi:hypothetical protein